jgi:hypothetical protein
LLFAVVNTVRLMHIPRRGAEGFGRKIHPALRRYGRALPCGSCGHHARRRRATE